MAADKNFVALYFEETRQLSIYKFNQTEGRMTTPRPSISRTENAICPALLIDG
jgi:hypothetical protein